MKIKVKDRFSLPGPIIVCDAGWINRFDYYFPMQQPLVDFCLWILGALVPDVMAKFFSGSRLGCCDWAKLPLWRKETVGILANFFGTWLRCLV